MFCKHISHAFHAEVQVFIQTNHRHIVGRDICNETAHPIPLRCKQQGGTGNQKAQPRNLTVGVDSSQLPPTGLSFQLIHFKTCQLAVEINPDDFILTRTETVHQIVAVPLTAFVWSERRVQRNPVSPEHTGSNPTDNLLHVGKAFHYLIRDTRQQFSNETVVIIKSRNCPGISDLRFHKGKALCSQIPIEVGHARRHLHYEIVTCRNSLEEIRRKDVTLFNPDFEHGASDILFLPFTIDDSHS